MQNLNQASRQWATRPEDERFWTLQEMYAATRTICENSVQAHSPLKELRFDPMQDNDLRLVGKSGKAASVGHYAFGQVSRLLGAPADYMRSLPAPLAAQCLNHGIQDFDGDDRQMQLLCTRGDTLHVRAATSDKYTRIWNSDIIDNLIKALPEGWKIPPARPVNQGSGRTRTATIADVSAAARHGGGIQIKEGDTLGPAGLYASDKDMFAFLVNEQNPIMVPGNEHPMYRGFFLWNSEVGDCTLGLLSFLYSSVCGNHIVWGADRINEVSFRHVGNADSRAWGGMRIALKNYSDGTVQDITARVKAAQAKRLGDTKDDVVQALFAKRISGLSRGDIEASYEAAEAHPGDHGSDPKSVWGMVQGMTRHSQTRPYTDNRVRLDRTAGKIMEMAF